MRAARKRGIQSRLLKEADIAVLFLGYQTGAFKEMIAERPEMDGLDLHQFTDWVRGLGQQGELWVTLGKSAKFKERDRVPIAWWWVYVRMEHLIEPHVVWMPWASPRQKIEGTLRFALDQKVDREIGIFAKKEDQSFWVRLAQYGILSPVGTWPAYFPNGDTAKIWRVV